ncbi:MULTISPECIES: histidinol-phosphate transaminase [Clostridium]|uniref:histidinol-phosphate transaminase n=1 Tax=Clostridium TaxID=1485 RepID=UPI002153275E|nr:histidinol-phosphate transaminase [Clostridium sp. LY3-2]MCR6515670.1 histidinol-phosphate transaminase [Clostridium sp. LY3-2]
MRNIEKYNQIEEGDFIRLNGNESPFNLKEEALEEILKKIKLASFNRYPESENLNLREAYSKYIGIDKDSIICGNGSDEMIALVINSLINKGDKVLTLNPDFSMYDYYVQINEGNLLKIDCKEDGSYKIEDFLSIREKKEIRLIIFSNPNNPTGFTIKNNDIEKLLKEYKNAKILIDEAYTEFNEETIIEKIKDYDNLLVTRTLSKAFGLASIRVGFLIGNKNLIQSLNNNKVPYNVNSISQIIGCEILKDTDSINSSIKYIKNERERLFNRLKEIQNANNLDIKFYKSFGNYIFGRSKSKEELVNYLKENKILIRSFKDDSFRISVGSFSENNILIDKINSFYN